MSGKLLKPGKIHVIPAPQGGGQLLITWMKGRSRRVMQVTPHADSRMVRPIAAESFVLDPDQYHALLDRAEEAVRA